MSVKIALLKSNGLRGQYEQVTSKLAGEVIAKLNPRTLFTRGSLILGTGNPFTLLNPRHIAAIEVESDLPLQDIQPPGVTSAKQLADKTAFMIELEKHLKEWRKLEQGGPGSPQEALLQFELAGGWEYFVHVKGTLPDRETERKVVETLLDLPVICIKRIVSGYCYINPENIIRMRIFHSNREPFRPVRVLPLDAQEI